MSQRCRDTFAWWRTFMSSAGPAPITRLVLCGHMLFMDRDGSHCIVGIRHLAEITGLNKNTVAEHRTLATAAGWLILSDRPTTSRRREIYPAIPDRIAEAQRQPQSSVTGQSLSSPAGQLMANLQSGLSCQGDATVQFPPSGCPTLPDIPLRPLLPLGSAAQKIVGRQQSTPRKLLPRPLAQSCLRAWLLTDPRVQQYKHDVDALALLAPLSCRYPGYKDFMTGLLAVRILRND